MNPQTLAELIADIEDGDPVDLSDLSIDEENVRQLMANHLCEIDQRLAEHGLAAEERLEMMAAIAAHTLVENLALQLERLQNEDGDSLTAFRKWLGKHGLH